MKRIVLVLVLAACSKKADKPDTGPTCAEVTDNMLKIMQAKYPGHSDMGAMGNREQAIQQCEARKMPAAEKRCIVGAKSVEELATCRRASVPKGSGSAAASPAK